MNPYEATIPNVLARVGAWLRGLARRYRRALLVAAVATVTLAVGVSADQAPAPVVSAAR